MNNNKAKIKYTPTTEKDRAFFIHVHHTAYRDTIEEMFGWDEERQDQLANRPFDEGGIHIVWHDDERIGVVGWEYREDHLWLKELFLLPEYQGLGIGSQIIKNTIKQARSLAKDVRLRTLKANLRAKELYERHGFEVTEATDIHWNMVLPYTKNL
jgi:GNAT superfamily N-acetyltransferase